jgi:hypothetical protein
MPRAAASAPRYTVKGATVSLGNQPLETQHLDLAPVSWNHRLAGTSVSKTYIGTYTVYRMSYDGYWKLSADFFLGFLETGWLAQEVRFPTLTHDSAPYSLL